jgi:hypothetical protein
MTGRNESWFWRMRVKPALEGLDPVRIEDRSAMGFPDVECTLGAIELKWAAKPGKPATCFMHGALRPGQRAFLWKRWQAGGSAWCLIGVGGEHFILLSGQEASLRMGKEAVWGDMLHRMEPVAVLRERLRGELWHRTRHTLDRITKLT